MFVIDPQPCTIMHLMLLLHAYDVYCINMNTDFELRSCLKKSKLMLMIVIQVNDPSQNNEVIDFLYMCDHKSV